MTVDELLEEAKSLTQAEREELAHRLLALAAEVPTPKTGNEIVSMLRAMDGPIELVDPHITDPVEWVKTQRQKRMQRLIDEE